MKKISALILSVLIVFCFVGCNKDKAPEDLSAKAGSIVSVPVKLTKNPGMVAAKLVIEYDTEQFEYMTANNGAIFKDFNINNETGEITAVLMSDFSSADDIKETGTLFTINLKIKKGAKQGTEQLKIVEYQFINYNEQEVNALVSIPKIKIEKSNRAG